MAADVVGTEVALSLHYPSGTILHSSRYKLVSLAPASDTGSCLFDGVSLIANASEFEGSQLRVLRPSNRVVDLAPMSFGRTSRKTMNRDMPPEPPPKFHSLHHECQAMVQAHEKVYSGSVNQIEIPESQFGGCRTVQGSESKKTVSPFPFASKTISHVPRLYRLAMQRERAPCSSHSTSRA